MVKSGLGFVYLAITVVMMALALPVIMLLVNTLNKSSHPYMTDKTLVQPREAVEIVTKDGAKYPFIRQGINLKPEDVIFSYLIFDEYSPETTKGMRIQNIDGTKGGQFDMTSLTLRSNKYDLFPELYTGYNINGKEIKLKEVTKKQRWFLLWDSDVKSWIYSTEQPKNY